MTAEHVSKAVKVLNSAQGKAQGWTMAVKSGGHAPYASNNVQNGVTIDLARLNSVSFHSCKPNSKVRFPPFLPSSQYHVNILLCSMDLPPSAREPAGLKSTRPLNRKV